MVRRDKDEEPTLVSYLVPEFSQWAHWLKDQGLEARPEEEGMAGMLKRFRLRREDVRTVLKSKLPSYTVPLVIIPLKRMPLNPNGKIDKPNNGQIVTTLMTSGSECSKVVCSFRVGQT